MDTRAVELDRHRLLTESSEHAYSNDSVVHTTESSHSVRWDRVKEVGVGAFGTIWLEKDEVGELRAVKCLPRTSFKVDFLREIHALAELRGHPDHFVHFLGWFEDRHNIFIAMEYIECGDLRKYMQDSWPKARREVREITQQILKGLVILHGKSICHRDLKPRNILIASFSPIWVKITDFGSSKREIGTQLRTHCGTPGYRAPEQQGILPRSVMPGKAYTNAVDLWALGSIVHEILTSEIPFISHEADTGTPISGLEETMQVVDTILLFTYCQGSVQFPTKCLENSIIGTHGVDFVKRLVIVDPRRRMSASEALKSPWPLEKNDSETLRNQFSRQGVQISLEAADHLIAHRQVDKAYIMQALPGLSEKSIKVIWHAGASNGSLFLAKSLLGAIDNIDVMINGVTALQAAAMGGYFDIVKLLLTTGAEVNTKPSTYSRTTLQAAAEGGYVDVVKLLLSAGAEVNAKPSVNGRTALQAAVEGGSVDVVKLLLSAGAEVNARPTSNNGRTALQAAVESGENEHLNLPIDLGTLCYPMLKSSFEGTSTDLGNEELDFDDDTSLSLCSSSISTSDSLFSRFSGASSNSSPMFCRKTS